MDKHAEQARRTLPPGGRFETWTADDGWGLRVGVWPGGGRGTLLFLNGRGDFLEKYAEALWHWRDRGWSIVASDWRGQGGSGRFVDAASGAKRSATIGGARDGFARFEADTCGLIARVGQTMPGPLVSAGHSMGGHVLARAMLNGGLPIARALLLSPMLGLPRGGLAGLIASGACALGMAARPAFGQRARGAAADEARAAALTSDAARAGDEAWWLARHPELASPGATWGWVRAATISIAALRAGGRVDVPVRAVLAGADTVVDSAAAAALLARRIGAETLLGVLPHARHELLRETDEVRAAVWALADPWLEQA